MIFLLLSQYIPIYSSKISMAIFTHADIIELQKFIIPESQYILAS
jgi:hypothetical protein